MRAWIIGGLLLAAILTACNGGGESATPTPLPGGRTSAPTAGKDGGRFAELAAKYLAGVDGKYVYRYTGTLGQFTEIQLGLYRLGTDDRFDWGIVNVDFPSETITIVKGAEFYLCTRASGFAACQVSSLPEMEGLRALAGGALEIFPILVTEADTFEVDELADATIAGVTGKCFQATRPERIGDGTPGAEEITVCFSEAGALLSLGRKVVTGNAQQDEEYILDLLEVSAAQASDFEPIARVQ